MRSAIDGTDPTPSKPRQWRIGAASVAAVAAMFAAQYLALRWRDEHPIVASLLVFTPLVALALLNWVILRVERDSDATGDERSRSRRARNRIYLATAWYLVLIYVSQWILKFIEGTHPVIIGTVAALPIIGLVLVLRGIIQAHRESDELHRRIDSEAAVIAACVVGLGTFATALVASAVKQKWPMMPTFHVGPLLIAVWGIAKWRLTRRYA